MMATAGTTGATMRSIPEYGHRLDWQPTCLEDFGDGGAFPEIVAVAQYPLNMGRQRSMALTLGVRPKVELAKESGESGTDRPTDEDELKLAEKTQGALDRVLQKGREAVERGRGTLNTAGDTSYVKYTPAQQGQEYASGEKTRLIKMVEAPVDPLEPPSFKHQRAPRGPPSPPAPVMHSPPRRLTVEDQREWKVPPVVSSWKNPKGYVIPLDKRIGADGRRLQETKINDKFAKLAEALYVSELNAREEVEKRAGIQRRLREEEKRRKEVQLSRMANEARQATARIVQQSVREETDRETSDRMQRDAQRGERRLVRDEELRKARRKGKDARDGERDVSEQVALGMHVARRSEASMYDTRLFNQAQGVASGFGDEESYNVYDKPFREDVKQSIYRPSHGDADTYGDSGRLGGSHSKPVEFETAAGEERGTTTTAADEADPFGLDTFMDRAKRHTAVKPPSDIERGATREYEFARPPPARSHGGDEPAAKRRRQ